MNQKNIFYKFIYVIQKILKMGTIIMQYCDNNVKGRIVCIMVFKGSCISKLFCNAVWAANSFA